ncbi:cyclin-dependent protein kinase inhibitor SMR6-like [Apium graveolens]|uniref:cyclin-dependent protein kinase inhibitor SMR6-like n=1 Tax=Apium graveolens TaxID=4045 RepID=UPI003D7AA00E
MGFSKKTEGMIIESEAKKRMVLSGITLRTTLKPIFTKHEEGQESSISTTPTSEESRSSSTFRCPPAPRKRKTKPLCYYGGVREYFSTPPDLESVFIRRAEKA